MKIDRLLSIIIFLLDRKLVSAREMAQRFGVTQRTIQRDMETIELAGIPVYSVQGPQGGYGILESFKMDRHIVGAEDLFYIVTALRGVASSLGEGEDHGKLDTTLEKMRGLMPSRFEGDMFEELNGRFSLDFSMLGGELRHRTSFAAVREAVEGQRMLEFAYTSSRGETLRRRVEAMTLVFKWRSWYLYGWCSLREDYRLFRLSRIRDAVVSNQGFHRRSMGFEEFQEKQNSLDNSQSIDVVLRFRPELRHIAEEYYEEYLEEPDGCIICRTRMPDDGWLYGFILSWGAFVEVLEPEHLRDRISEAAVEIREIYEKPE